MFGFERLDVWQLSIEYANTIYQVTSQFPAAERFGLTNQLRRAAVSIAANIAEGSSRSTTRDFARFVEIAFGSLMETVSHLNIAHAQRFLSDIDYDKLHQTAERLSRMLSGLKSSLLEAA